MRGFRGQPVRAAVVVALLVVVLVLVLALVVELVLVLVLVRLIPVRPERGRAKASPTSKDGLTADGLTGFVS